MADSPKTILVVDDDPDAVAFLTAVLEDHGFRTLAARDGVEALNRIEKAPPDLIALDITMPEKSGVAVYRRLKEEEALRKIPVVIITGVSGNVQEFLSLGGEDAVPDGYLSKPVDHQEFLKVVRSLLT